jgi:hypothetical protein
MCDQCDEESEVSWKENDEPSCADLILCSLAHRSPQICKIVATSTHFCRLSTTHNRRNPASDRRAERALGGSCAPRRAGLLRQPDFARMTSYISAASVFVGGAREVSHAGRIMDLNDEELEIKGSFTESRCNGCL